LDRSAKEGSSGGAPDTCRYHSTSFPIRALVVHAADRTRIDRGNPDAWMYLSTVLDDFSRYIIAWKLCSTMRAEDVTDTLDLALVASGCTSANVHHRPRLLSDNGPCYIAGELAEYIEAQRMSHVRGAPFHPQTQGKIERWHQTMKNRILLENYFLPGDLETQIEAFVEHYNHRRYHESLSNVTPADAYFGRAEAIIQQREMIKRQTIEHRRLQHRKLAA
jgi:putative transposase